MRESRVICLCSTVLFGAKWLLRRPVQHICSKKMCLVSDTYHQASHAFANLQMTGKSAPSLLAAHCIVFVPTGSPDRFPKIECNDEKIARPPGKPLLRSHADARPAHRTHGGVDRPHGNYQSAGRGTSQASRAGSPHRLSATRPLPHTIPSACGWLMESRRGPCAQHVD
jgi:hypothetical protein